MTDKILVIDGDRNSRLILSDWLTGEGFNVMTAESEDESLGCFRKESPDLVVADLKTVLGDGHAVPNSIKKMHPDADLIVVARRREEAKAVRCLRRGAYDYLLKPLKEREVLMAAVRRALQKKHLEAENKRLLNELQALAITDLLTGLPNHSHLTKCLADEVVRSTRYNHNCTVLVADIDRLRKINEGYGHSFGDFVLKRIAQLLVENLRLTDMVFRGSGAEFVLLLPETRKYHAVRIAERILECIRHHNFLLEECKAQVTLSMGAAEFPSEARDAAGLTGLAYRRVDAAKQAGRDCFVCENQCP